MRLLVRYALAVALVAASGTVLAQGDVGLVNLVSGDVAFVPQIGQPGKVRSFMKVREGDRFDLPAGAQVRVVYFQGSRQERWQGPASFRATKMQGTALQGAAADVQMLPGSVPQRMARVPELMQNAKLGGIQVRGAANARRATDEAIGDARNTYESLRKQLPGDDITAELYLFSALNDNQLYEEMAPLVDEMLRKQPGSEDVKALGAWLKTRRGR
jgi:hypothetical protein